MRETFNNVNKNVGIIIMSSTPQTEKKPTKKPKSSLQLKRERIAKNLKQIEEKARLFREKLNSEYNINNGTQTKSNEYDTITSIGNDGLDNDRASTA